MSVMLEQHLTVQDIAKSLGVSPNSVRRMFDQEPGVVRISNRTVLCPKHSRHVTLRIPLSVYDRVRERLSVGLKVKPRHRAV